MQITSVIIGKITIPLIRPFITAIRRTEHVEDIVVLLKTACGKVGYGSAAATPLITGDSADSIIWAIKQAIAPRLLGQDIINFNQLLQMNQQTSHNNTSAKAAIDIALHDLFAQKCNLPLHQLFGGSNRLVSSCITISVKDKQNMADDAIALVKQGFTTLKIKVGLNSKEDIERIRVIRNAINSNINLTIDANQGWNAKEAIKIIRQIEVENLGVNFVEQPVAAHDITNLKFVHEQVTTPVIADEGCFSPVDALNLVKANACSGINIKLMKCGGLKNALAIYNITKAANMQPMVGCMLESPIGVAAAASLVAGLSDIKFADLDPIALIKDNPITGGATIKGNLITLSEMPGLGIKSLGNSFTVLCKITHNA